MTKAPKVGTSGTHSYQHDAVGNRTWRDYGLSTVAKYSWDELGRMRAFQGSEAAAPLYGFTARYRPDGLRAQKVNGLQLGVNYTEENEVSGYFDNWATDKPTTREAWPVPPSCRSGWHHPCRQECRLRKFEPNPGADS
jgi:hypothetical protein